MKCIKYKNEQFEQLSNEVIGRSRRSLFFVIVIGPQKFFSLSQGYFKQGRVFFYILADDDDRKIYVHSGFFNLCVLLKYDAKNSPSYSHLVKGRWITRSDPHSTEGWLYME